MKKVFFFSLLVWASASLLPSATVMAAPTGCCIKTNIKDPTVKPTTMNATEDQCKAVEKETNGLLKGTFKAGFVPVNNDCKEVPPRAPEHSLNDPVYFTPAVGIPGSKFRAGADIKIEESTTSLAEYVIAIAKYATGVIGIIAVIAFMAGGVLWLTSAGNQEQVGSAKTIIGSSVAGMILAFSSFILLAMVNTNLVNLRVTPINTIQRVSIETGCCIKTDLKTGAKTTENLEKDLCTKITYAKTEFKSYNEAGWVASNNTCIATTGCCSFSNNVCVNNVPAKTCESEDTSWFMSLVPYFGGSDVDTTHTLGEKCSAVPDCSSKIICSTIDECKQMLTKKSGS